VFEEIDRVYQRHVGKSMRNIVDRGLYGGVSGRVVSFIEIIGMEPVKGKLESGDL
jgi:hypothetical protein